MRTDCVMSVAGSLVWSRSRLRTQSIKSINTQPQALTLTHKQTQMPHVAHGERKSHEI
jgi:hypothetical protein